MTDFTHLLQKADTIAEEYHKCQTGKAGPDYIGHPRRVFEHCNSIKAKIVALLHDTIEDTEVTPDFLLRQGFTREIVDAVLFVTHKEDESYDDFIIRASLNPIDKEVKIADLLDNMDITHLNYPLQKKNRKGE